MYFQKYQSKKRKYRILYIAVALQVLTGCFTQKYGWEWASEENTVEGYEEFVRRNKDSPYVEEAEIRIEKLRWKETVGKGDIESYEKFISKYPRSKYELMAKEKKEKEIEIEKLEQKLESSSMQEKMTAVYRLGKMGYKARKSIPKFYRMLDDPNEYYWSPGLHTSTHKENNGDSVIVDQIIIAPGKDSGSWMRPTSPRKVASEAIKKITGKNMTERSKIDKWLEKQIGKKKK